MPPHAAPAAAIGGCSSSTSAPARLGPPDASAQAHYAPSAAFSAPPRLGAGIAAVVQPIAVCQTVRQGAAHPAPDPPPLPRSDRCPAFLPLSASFLQAVADGVFYAELNELLMRELGGEGYSGVEVR